MMSSYDITVRCKSYAKNDDDLIGIVAAEVKAADGRPSILVVNRSCNCSNSESTQPYGHFYITVNKTWTGNGLVPVPRYFDEGMSCTYLYGRNQFQQRFTATVNPANVSSDSLYTGAGKPYGSPVGHPAGQYWPALNSDGTF